MAPIPIPTKAISRRWVRLAVGRSDGGVIAGQKGSIPRSHFASPTGGQDKKLPHLTCCIHWMLVDHASGIHLAIRHTSWPPPAPVFPHALDLRSLSHSREVHSVTANAPPPAAQQAS